MPISVGKNGVCKNYVSVKMRVFVFFKCVCVFPSRRHLSVRVSVSCPRSSSLPWVCLRLLNDPLVFFFFFLQNLQLLYVWGTHCGDRCSFGIVLLLNHPFLPFVLLKSTTQLGFYARARGSHWRVSARCFFFVVV